MTDKDKAYGGVVFDDEGRVLLREPSNHFDGYVWTFPKGRPSDDESPRDAAVRETQEETGVFTRVVGEVPGTFPGGTTDNKYFLMKPTGAYRPPDRETWCVRWASPDEARELLQQTTNHVGSDKDLAVLEAGLAAFEALPETEANA